MEADGWLIPKVLETPKPEYTQEVRDAVIPRFRLIQQPGNGIRSIFGLSADRLP